MPTIQASQITSLHNLSVDLAVSGGAVSSTSQLVFPAQQRVLRFLAAGGSGYVNLPPMSVSNAALATGAPVTYDFTSYTAFDASSVTTLIKLKYLIIYNNGSIDLQVGGAASNQLIGSGFIATATGLIQIPPGRFWEAPLADAGLTVSPTVKDFKIHAVSSTGSYLIFAAGSSA